MYSISYRQLEETRGERGVAVDHATLHRRVIKYAPEFEKEFRRQRPVGRSWRVEETSVKIKGKWASSIAPSTKRATRLTFCLTPKSRSGCGRGLFTPSHS